MSQHSEEILDKIRISAAPLIEGFGFEIVDLRIFRANRRFILRFLVDRPEGGISLDECSRINEAVGRILEERDILGGESYVLEVSSPGVDRPLFNGKDFSRVRGRKIRVFLNEPRDGRLELEGEVEAFKDGCVLLKIEDKVIKLPLTKIKKAKQVI